MTTPHLCPRCGSISLEKESGHAQLIITRRTRIGNFDPEWDEWDQQTQDVVLCKNCTDKLLEFLSEDIEVNPENIEKILEETRLNWRGTLNALKSS